MELIRKDLDFDIKQVGAPSDRILEFIGSTADVDRYGDIIEVDGWDLTAYLQNPVFLWAHDYKQPPVGKAVKVEKTDRGLLFRIQFPTAETYSFADTVYKLYLGGYLRATSVGFRNLEREPILDEEGRQTGWRYKKQELYELSAVPVPANPNALIIAVQKGVVTPDEVENLMEVPFERNLVERPYTNEHSCRLKDPGQYEEFARKNCAAKVDGKCVDHIYGIREGKSELQALRYRLEEGWTETQAKDNCKKHGGMFEPAAPEPAREEGEMEEECKGVIPYKEYPTEPEDAPWDGPAEIKAAEVDDLKVICAWFNSEKPDVKSSYKLPHHRARGYKVVWRGVSAAMAALLGARGGVHVPEGDRKGIYNHLAQHYAQFDKEPPELKAYGKADLALIELGFPPLMDQYLRGETDLLKAVSGLLQVHGKGKDIDTVLNVLIQLLAFLYDWLLGNEPMEIQEPAKRFVQTLRDSLVKVFAQGSSKALNEFFKAGEGSVVKAGAVLSAKNKAALKQAQALIQEVLDSAEPSDFEAGKQGKDIYSLVLNPGYKPQGGRPAGEMDIGKLLKTTEQLHQLLKGEKDHAS